ncbi:MAG TPA: NADH-quinone oxidoreductase subunit J [Fluviicola sp.]|jgi:NADH-quinone oxidoreductase subunit J|nr:NADH-quinone oxidoreductase subunit J [Fluviicola sp.]
MSLDILFYLLGGLTIGSALMVVLSKHPVRSVLYLVLTFFFISSHYVLMNAQFIAIVNIMVYAGAIMVLFLFVLMLLNLNKDNEPKHSPLMTIGAGIAGGALFLVLIAALKDAVVAAPQLTENSASSGLVENLGYLLFTKYVLPFEVSSVLFLSAMVGAVLLAKREKQTID